MTYDLSFIFPCLNEEKTISLVIKELQEVLNTMPIRSEIIVADNGSTDNSAKLAKDLGCHVVHVERKGYGEALKGGFGEATGKYIAFADIDGSYSLNCLSQMYQKITADDLDMVIANRINGKIEKGAMPFLHRYLGTPILTKLINILFHGKLTDCNSGFRIIKKETYEKWNLDSSGMEFASELLIKALKNNAKISEVPAGLRVDKRDKRPHLKTWRDGMRHLLLILSNAPKLFEIAGFILLFSASFFEILSCIIGPIQIKGISFFDFHSKIILLATMILGLQSYLFSISMYVLGQTDKPFKITQKLIGLSEETLFAICIASSLCILSGFVYIINFWVSYSFHEVIFINPLLDFLYFLLFVLITSFGLVQIHILKRIKK